MFEKKIIPPSTSAVLRKRERAPLEIYPNAFLSELQQKQEWEIKCSRTSKKKKRKVKKTIFINPDTFEQKKIYSTV
ncbi:hypothetical protein K8R32_01560 [bacterium]|nr:hypothetical protein [bacterium]